MSRAPQPLAARLARHTTPRGECLIWTGTKTSHGYGSVTVGRRTRAAHRVSYELAKGPIPDGLTLDHLCCVKLCVNPDHLEPVTALENIRRWRVLVAKPGHCIHGHEYTPENTYRRPLRPNRPECRKCNAVRARLRPPSPRAPVVRPRLPAKGAAALCRKCTPPPFPPPSP
jgi:hypothetical protein